MSTSPPPTPPAEIGDRRFQQLTTPTEWIEVYRPGGLHPVHLGDELDRFRIIRKLGYGSSSTVWLARDNNNDSLVAIKIMVADAPDAAQELQMYELISKAPIEDKFKERIVIPLETFRHDGPNGTHQCLVFPPMGPNVNILLDELLDEYETTQPAESSTVLCRSKSILKDTLLGLHCLHSCRIVHADLNPGNMLSSLRQLTEQDLVDLAKETVKIPEDEDDPDPYTVSKPAKRLDGKQDKWAPDYLCIDQPLFEHADPSGSGIFKLADLGAAFFFDNPPEKPVTPVALRAPELVLGCPYDHTIDIWAFGCLMFEFLTTSHNRLLAVYGMGGQIETDDTHLLFFTEILGHLPPTLFEKWFRRHRYFGPNLESIRRDVSSGEASTHQIDASPSMEEAFEKQKLEAMGTEEVAKVLSLMRRCLKYDPKMRPSTAELLEDEWFKAIE